MTIPYELWAAVTEEEEKPIAVETVAGGYICAFDPIDGSSNLDACISSGWVGW